MTDKPKMKRFSERMGITKPPEIQLNGINTPLRNSLWDAVLIHSKRYMDDELKGLCDRLAVFFFKIPLDSIQDIYYSYGRFRRNSVEDWIKGKFYNLQWYEVYEFIEFLVQNREGSREKDFQEILNYILERENSAYRWVDNKFAPLTNEQEIKEIEEAIEKTVEVGLEGAATHLSKALSLLAKKPQPDYPNSIKESISAVASLIAILSGKGKDDFVPVLEELSKKMPIHGALKQGFIKIYGYTSDEDGIRHAMLDEPNVGLDEAKFMLVSCSAFTNYLISKAQKAGLLKEG